MYGLAIWAIFRSLYIPSFHTVWLVVICMIYLVFLLLYAFLYSVKSTSEVMFVMFIIFRIKDIAAYPTAQSGVRGWGYGV